MQPPSCAVTSPHLHDEKHKCIGGERHEPSPPTAAAPGSAFTLSSSFHIMETVSNLYGVSLLVSLFFFFF